MVELFEALHGRKVSVTISGCACNGRNAAFVVTDMRLLPDDDIDAQTAHTTTEVSSTLHIADTDGGNNDSTPGDRGAAQTGTLAGGADPDAERTGRAEPLTTSRSGTPNTQKIPCANTHPHITVCVARGAQPRDSNAMLNSRRYEFLELKRKRGRAVQFTGILTVE